MPKTPRDAHLSPTEADLLHLVAHSARRRYLDALDIPRRELVLTLTSDQLLRKPRAKQNWTQALADELGAQVDQQMKAGRRRMFRGPVSVEIALHALNVPNPPSSPPAVKAYLDLLYADDRAVVHLQVTRHAPDNPLLNGDADRWWTSGPFPRVPHGPDQGVEVSIRVLSARLYTSAFDSVFSLRSEGRDELHHDYDEATFDNSSRFWTHGATDDDLDTLAELLDDDRDERLDSLFRANDPEFAERFARDRQRDIARLQQHLALNSSVRQ